MDFSILIIWIIPLSFLGASGVFLFSLFFFDEIYVSKQNSSRWDAAFHDVTAGAIMFAYVPLKEHQAYMGYQSQQTHIIFLLEDPSDQSQVFHIPFTFWV